MCVRQPIIRICSYITIAFSQSVSHAHAILLFHLLLLVSFFMQFSIERQFNFRKEQSMANLNARFYDECNFIIKLIPL